MEFFKVIEQAVGQIQSNETVRSHLADKVSDLRSSDFSNFNSREVPEPFLVTKIVPSKLDFRVVGGDSGFVSKSLHSIDLVLVRSVGVLFEYEDGVVKRSRYWPNFFDFPKPFLVNHALDLNELGLSASLLRLREEIQLAKQMIADEKPDFCLLDGSIVPQYEDKPSKDSGLSENYYGVIDAFTSLYETAAKHHTELVGCVKDSRGSRFCSIAEQIIFPKLNRIKPAGIDHVLDSVLLDYVLQKNERSFAFPYTKSIKEHAVLQDFGQWGERVYACYVKPSDLDRPLRFEFLHSQKSGSLTEHTNKVASAMTALSSLHREFAHPSVLIEADLRARLKPEEVELVFNKICDKLSKRVRMQLRRNSRPF